MKLFILIYIYVLIQNCLSAVSPIFCDSTNYKYDEKINQLGKCESNCDCDGLRICNIETNICVGIARPPDFYRRGGGRSRSRSRSRYRRRSRSNSGSKAGLVALVVSFSVLGGILIFVLILTCVAERSKRKQKKLIFSQKELRKNTKQKDVPLLNVVKPLSEQERVMTATNVKINPKQFNE